MAVTAGPVTPEASAAPPAGVSGPTEPPRLADGVELLGEYQDSGYSQPPSLVRRADGQVIQMSPLLYRVTSRIDGSRDLAAIAELVSADLGRSLNADQVRMLITAKLLPLGIVAAKASCGGAAPAAPPKANPLLALRARGTLLPERAANAAGTLFRPLFRWPVIVAVVGCVAGRGRLAVRRSWAGPGTSADPARPGGPAHRARPLRALRRVPRVRARDRVPLWRRAPRRDRRRHLPGLAVVLHQRHRLLPAQPRRPAAHRPRRPVLQPDLHAGPGRHLLGHLGARSCSSSSPSRTWRCWSSCSRSSASTATSSSATSPACRTCSPASPPSCAAP